MKAYIVPKGCRNVEELRLADLPDPVPGPGQVLVRLRAASLNFRDQAVAAGTYFGSAVSRDTIPLSDGAGEVAAVGTGITGLRVGDRVMGTFFQTPPSGSVSAEQEPLGSPLDGMLAEKAVLHENGAVPVPSGLTWEEASTLPCAAVTAWHALMCAGKPVKPGDTVLVLGTGGVSVFALLFARAAGATVIATSSSDEKLETVRALGAAVLINYRTTPDWEKEVLSATGGRGVDCVIEVGGRGTLAKSFRSIAKGGKIALIGTLAGPEGDSSPYALMRKWGSLHGIFVGDRMMFEQMNRAIESERIRPVVDRVFPFEAAREAYRYQGSGSAIGKVVIRID